MSTNQEHILEIPLISDLPKGRADFAKRVFELASTTSDVTLHINSPELSGWATRQFGTVADWAPDIDPFADSAIAGVQDFLESGVTFAFGLPGTIDRLFSEGVVVDVSNRAHEVTEIMTKAYDDAVSWFPPSVSALLKTAKAVWEDIQSGDFSFANISKHYAQACEVAASEACFVALRKNGFSNADAFLMTGIVQDDNGALVAETPPPYLERAAQKKYANFTNMTVPDEKAFMEMSNAYKTGALTTGTVATAFLLPPIVRAGGTVASTISATNSLVTHVTANSAARHLAGSTGLPLKDAVSIQAAMTSGAQTSATASRLSAAREVLFGRLPSGMRALGAGMGAVTAWSRRDIIDQALENCDPTAVWVNRTLMAVETASTTAMVTGVGAKAGGIGLTASFAAEQLLELAGYDINQNKMAEELMDIDNNTTKEKTFRTVTYGDVYRIILAKDAGNTDQLSQQERAVLKTLEGVVNEAHFWDGTTGFRAYVSKRVSKGDSRENPHKYPEHSLVNEAFRFPRGYLDVLERRLERQENIDDINMRIEDFELTVGQDTKSTYHLSDIERDMTRQGPLYIYLTEVLKVPESQITKLQKDIKSKKGNLIAGYQNGVSKNTEFSLSFDLTNANDEVIAEAGQTFALPDEASMEEYTLMRFAMMKREVDLFDSQRVQRCAEKKSSLEPANVSTPMQNSFASLGVEYVESGQVRVPQDALAPSALRNFDVAEANAASNGARTAPATPAFGALPSGIADARRAALAAVTQVS